MLHLELCFVFKVNISLQVLYGEVFIVVQVKQWPSDGHTRDLISLIQTSSRSHHFDFPSLWRI